MSKPIRLLIVEDSEDDALLLLRELRRGGYEPQYERVEIPEAMKAALERQTWDLVISDYVMPKFSGPAALALLKESELDLPFIIVSGNIGEDIAVESMKAGAHDYIIKGNLKRLVPAVERELREAESRRERRESERRVIASNALLKLFSRTFSRKEYLDAVVDLIQKWCDCRCVGLRAVDGTGNIPYESYRGFSLEFWEQENCLSLEKDECICLRVVRERPDRRELSVMTPEGSFHCNSAVAFITDLKEKEKTRYRGACVGNGFRSLAVIPIRYREKTIGALHLADEREGKVPLKTVEFIELIAPLIGEALYRFSIEDELRRGYAELSSSREQLRNLTMYLQSVREEERTRIAREIHDELGQALTALKLDTSWLTSKYRDHEPLVEKTKSMAGLIDTTIRTVKRIISDLRPSILDHLGLIPALEWQAKQFEERTGIPCAFTFQREDITLDRERSTAIFRIFQETLTNVLRHAGATKVEAHIERTDGAIILRVKDNGRGITDAEIEKAHSFGLLGIRERVNFYGGTVSIAGVPGLGTTVTVRMPCPE